MRRFSAIIFLLYTFALAMSAQHIQRNGESRLCDYSGYQTGARDGKNIVCG